MPAAQRKSNVSVSVGEQWHCLNCGGFNPCEHLPNVDANDAATFDRPEVNCPSCATVYTVEESNGVYGELAIHTRQNEHRRGKGKNTVAELDVARRAKAAAKRTEAARRVAVPTDDPVLAAIERAQSALEVATEARAYAYFEASRKYSLRQLATGLAEPLATVQRRVAVGRKLNDQLEAF